MTMTKYYLGGILKEINHLVNNIPAKGKPQEVLLYGYMLSLFDIGSDIDFLYTNDRFKNIPVLVRSFIETYVDMKLISNDIDFVNSLLLKADEEEKKKLLNLLKEETISEENKEILSNALSQVEKDISERSKNYKSQSISNKFEKLNMSWFHKTAYNDLCAFSHNEIRKIEQRHIDYNGDSNVTLNHLNQNKSKEVDLFISITETYLIDVLTIINIKTSLDCTKQLNRIKELK